MKSALIAILIASVSPSPQQYMEAGDLALRNSNWQQAIINFQSAINTNHLNDAGNSIGYWNIYWAEKQLGHTDQGMNALLGFIVYGSDYLDQPKFITQSFNKRFRLSRKLAYAIAYIQAIWARTNTYSCRSDEFSCYIVSVPTIDIFEKVMPFCIGNKVRSIRVVPDGTSLRADVTCISESGNKYENYYFTTNNEY